MVMERTKFMALGFSNCDDSKHIELMLNGLIKEVKKEVFNDIKKIFGDGWLDDESTEFNKLKKRHLSNLNH